MDRKSVATKNTDGHTYTLTHMLKFNDSAKERCQVEIVSEHCEMFGGPGAAQAKINAPGEEYGTRSKKKRGGRTALLDPTASRNASTQSGQMQVVRA